MNYSRLTEILDLMEVHEFHIKNTNKKIENLLIQYNEDLGNLQTILEDETKASSNLKDSFELELKNNGFKKMV